MPVGLSVSRLIKVDIVLAPRAVPFLSFDTLLIIGESNVINPTDRIRSYSDLESVAGDFGTTVPEYLAAQDFFSQIPQPSQVYIGRWVYSATSGLNVGGPLTALQQQMSNWTGINNGSFHLSIDGVAHDITGMDFTAQSNLNGVASVIQTALRAIGAGGYTLATCVWNGAQFTIGSGTTGASSLVSYLTTGGGGTDISAQLLMTSTTAEELVPGAIAETPLQAVAVLDNLSTTWYGSMFAAPDATDDELVAVAGYIEGAANPHLLGVTTNEAAALLAGDSTSIGARFKALGYTRSFAQWSSTDPYAVASFYGRAFTVDFSGTNTVINMMWKTMPGVLPENLSDSQADALNANNYNYYAEFKNGAAIIVNGTMASDFYFDERQGCDWLANEVQTNLFNLFYTTPTKIPQTDPGINLLTNNVEASCVQGVTNGFLAPGVWDLAYQFGSLHTGDVLSKGFYVFAPPVATQAVADRAARKSPLLQVAAKLAGAVNTAAVLISVDR